MPAAIRHYYYFSYAITLLRHAAIIAAGLRHFRECHHHTARSTRHQYTAVTIVTLQRKRLRLLMFQRYLLRHYFDSCHPPCCCQDAFAASCRCRLPHDITLPPCCQLSRFHAAFAESLLIHCCCRHMLADYYADYCCRAIRYTPLLLFAAMPPFCCCYAMRCRYCCCCRCHCAAGAPCRVTLSPWRLLCLVTIMATRIRRRRERYKESVITLIAVALFFRHACHYYYDAFMMPLIVSLAIMPAPRLFMPDADAIITIAAFATLRYGYTRCRC